MAAFRNRHSEPTCRAPRFCSRTIRSTSTSGKRRYAAASLSVNTSLTGPFAVGAGGVGDVGSGFGFVRGMVRSSFFLDGLAVLREVFRAGGCQDWLPPLYAPI